MSPGTTSSRQRRKLGMFVQEGDGERTPVKLDPCKKNELEGENYRLGAIGIRGEFAVEADGNLVLLYADALPFDAVDAAEFATCVSRLGQVAKGDTLVFDVDGNGKYEPLGGATDSGPFCGADIG